MGQKFTNGRSIRREKSFGDQENPKGGVVLRKERGGYLPSPGFWPRPRPAMMSLLGCLLSSSWYGAQKHEQEIPRIEKGGQQGQSRSWKLKEISTGAVCVSLHLQ